MKKLKLIYYCGKVFEHYLKILENRKIKDYEILAIVTKILNNKEILKN